MKKRKVNKASIISCFLFSAIILNTGCKKIAPENKLLNGEDYEYLTADGTPEISDTLPLDQLVIWRKPDSTANAVRNWINKIRAKGAVNVSRTCESCDSSLMLLTGPGIRTYVQGNTASGGKTSQSAPPSGDDGPAFNSLNFRVNGKPIMLTSGLLNALSSVINSKKSVKVALLDTGIDTFELNNYTFKPDTPSCIPGGARGWNFIAHNRNFHDDDPERHGSTVARFITTEVNKYHNNDLEILPVKTHAADGGGDLYTILCAFAYAQQRGVQIINASFGFYVPRLELYGYKIDPNVRLLREYVSHYLTKNKILLIAAAGNKDDVNERATFDLHRRVNPLISYPHDPRNLDEVSFYPASLARDDEFPNVIAVTTVDISTGTVSPTQNYSPNVIDIGVNANIVSKVSYAFINPRLTGSKKVEGSSFATPIVTGILSANYDRIESILKTNFTKPDLWKALGSSLVNSKNNLKVKVKDGRFMIE